MISAKDISLYFGLRALFDKISFNISPDQKIGLVGRNGSGKSTLLKVIAGSQKIDEGVFSIEKGGRFAYMPQEAVLESDKLILDETISVFQNVVDMRSELESLDEYFAQHKGDNTCHDKLERYAVLQEALADEDFEGLVVKAKIILQGLGFAKEQLEQPVCQLSSGWKMRIVLAKLLLKPVDFYLFDEPTNHLDIVAKDWFLDFLKDMKAGFLLVCHDRFFLDNACNYILELDRGKSKFFRGNYSQFLDQKEQSEAALQVAAKEQKKMFKKKMEVVEKFRYKASKAKLAQSLLKKLDKEDRVQIVGQQKKIAFSFAEIKRSGRIVLECNDLDKSFDTKQIFKDVSFELFRGDKAAIVAANGKGKTTLLSLLAGKYALQSGGMRFGHNVDWTMFEQDQELLLNKDNTILQEAEGACRSSDARKKVRGLLGAFLFPGDDVDKKIAVLSGGERNRVAMVKVLLQPANLLILDEPTNHLDLESKEVLLKALNKYEGTILFVSHDRAFLDGMATRILELKSDGIASWDGNYESYLYHKFQSQKVASGGGQPERGGFQKKNNASTALSGRESYELRKKVNQLERKISSLEAKLDRAHEMLGGCEYGTDEFVKHDCKVKEIRGQIDELILQWEKFGAKL
jgi:ATP-binding cassette, subfamily F, member 3